MAKTPHIPRRQREQLIRDAADLLILDGSRAFVRRYFMRLGYTEDQAKVLVHEAGKLRDNELRVMAKTLLGGRWPLAMQRLVASTYLDRTPTP